VSKLDELLDAAIDAHAKLVEREKGLGRDSDAGAAAAAAPATFATSAAGPREGA